jgi:hypothetical protein
MSLSSATCPGCGGDLISRPPIRRISGQPARGRLMPGVRRPNAPGRLEERLTGFGG